mgnify:CR=1 FL=1
MCGKGGGIGGAVNGAMCDSGEQNRPQRSSAFMKWLAGESLRGDLWLA